NVAAILERLPRGRKIRMRIRMRRGHRAADSRIEKRELWRSRSALSSHAMRHALAHDVPHEVERALEVGGVGRLARRDGEIRTRRPGPIDERGPLRIQV